MKFKRGEQSKKPNVDGLEAAEALEVPSTALELPRKIVKELPDTVIFAVTERFLLKHGRAGRVARWASEYYGFYLSRPQVYECVREAITRALLRLCPPAHVKLERSLGDWYGLGDAFVRVVDVDNSETLRDSASVSVNEHLAATTAEVLLDLVYQFGRRKDVVRIGFGSGTTAMRVAKKLAQLLRTAENVPPLALHGLTPAVSGSKPFMSPASFFTNFQDLPLDISYRVLVGPSYVKTSEFDALKKLPDVAEAFAARDEIDIVVSAFASAHDPHGELAQFMATTPVGETARPILEEHGYLGDVMFQPISASGPIRAQTLYRAVTLFDLDELVAMARRRDKAVVLVGGPCGACGRCRSDALEPLLRSPQLKLWSHLILDAHTARNCINLAAEATNRKKKRN